MTTSIFFWLVTTVLLATAVAEAQQPAKIGRVGFLTAGGDRTGPRFQGFAEGLRELGYVEGKNIVIEFRTAEARLDRIPDLVAELGRLKLDVLVITAQPAVRAAKQASITIPIVL